MSGFNDQVQRLARHIPNGELLARTDVSAFVSAVADKIERLQATVDRLPTLVELAGTDAIRNFIQHGHEMSERDCLPSLYRRGDVWRYHRRIAGNEWEDVADPIEAAEKARET